ncbi:hypothetical protein LEP1GSC185_2387 [Leptospira licerasiae serovar Varillal str. VAR 010]|uniref:Uncharacterized protein n=1 Tax=Leptospira licerasiae str. MMD4847 TaxID=1049971 RepID=A0ABP2RGA4_9LEPT|nr:hypothetical protein LEP1GSC185_2387 [Leptospira licerasiae serovar Varillal str. VAR 010]EJZ41924.1 hypothetical protein LEP1GSC178_0163 [Leptospira licerasiae str. MMD4847]
MNPKNKKEIIKWTSSDIFSPDLFRIYRKILRTIPNLILINNRLNSVILNFTKNSGK